MVRGKDIGLCGFRFMDFDSPGKAPTHRSMCVPEVCDEYMIIPKSLIIWQYNG